MCITNANGATASRFSRQGPKDSIKNWQEVHIWTMLCDCYSRTSTKRARRSLTLQLKQAMGLVFHGKRGLGRAGGCLVRCRKMRRKLHPPAASASCTVQRAKHPSPSLRSITPFLHKALLFAESWRGRGPCEAGPLYPILARNLQNPVAAHRTGRRRSLWLPRLVAVAARSVPGRCPRRAPMAVRAAGEARGQAPGAAQIEQSA